MTYKKLLVSLPLFLVLPAHAQLQVQDLLGAVGKVIASHPAIQGAPAEQGAGSAGVGGYPSSLDTIGLQLGDSPEKVMATAIANGYTLRNRSDYPAESGYPQRAGYMDFIKKAKSNIGAQSFIKVNFAYLSPQLVGVDRTEVFDEYTPSDSLSESLKTKYGQPTYSFSDSRGVASSLQWSSNASGRYAAAGNRCKPLTSKFSWAKGSPCSVGIEANIIESNTPGVAMGVSVTIFDFAANNRDYAARAQLANQAQKEGVRKAAGNQRPAL